MYIALNSNFIRTHIDDVVYNDDYYCPFCNAPLDIRKGDIRRHHFAHKKRHSCTDTWSSDRNKNDSTWHKQWQERFPIDNREISLCLGQTKHRADIMVDRTVLEFQHSPLPLNKFDDRNKFYAGLGHKVIWVFDFIDEDYDIEDDFYYWKKPKKTFRNYTDIARANQTELYFQIDENNLIHISDISQNGFEKFQGYTVSVDEFICNLKLQDGTFPPPKPEDICDDPVYLSFKEKYSIELNKQQERAVQSISGANLLLAVPGSGKTTVLITRIAYMIHCKDISPNSILALTYTKKAAEEMKNRYMLKFGNDGVTFKTINAIAEEIIQFYCKKGNRDRFTVLKEREITQYMRKAYTNITDDYATEAEIKQLSTEISRVKNNSDLPEMNAFTKEFDKIKEEYDRMLKQERKMDFDDQIIYSINVLYKYPDIRNYFRTKYKYICVDEAQDTSQKQHELIKNLVGDNIFMVGDEDQSVYSFRGAFPRALTNFEHNYPNPYILRMETNYRSYKEITERANQFISRNFNRRPKRMISIRDKGGAIDVLSYNDRHEEYNEIAKMCKAIQEETAVLYRDSDCAISLIAMLIKHNIPFNLFQNSTTFFTNRKVRDTLALIEFYLDNKNFDAFMKVFYLFGYKKEKAQQLVNYCQNTGIPIIDAAAVNINGKKMQDILSSLTDKTVPDIVKQAAYWINIKDNNQISKRYSEVLTQLGENVGYIKEYIPYIKNLKETIAAYENKSNGALLTLSTIHSAKGMEFKNVIILDAYEGIMPKTPEYAIEENEYKKDQYQEERRLFYVAMTRAKDKLSIVRLKNERNAFVDEIFGLDRSNFCPFRNNSANRKNESILHTVYKSSQQSLSTSSPVAISDNNTMYSGKATNAVDEEPIKNQAQVKSVDPTEEKHNEAMIRKQQREQCERDEIHRLHEETGAYIGSKINGNYEIATLEEITSTRISCGSLVEFKEATFMSYITGGFKEYRLQSIRMLWTKMCNISNTETGILKKIYHSLLETDPETAHVLEIMMQYAGIAGMIDATENDLVQK